MSYVKKYKPVDIWTVFTEAIGKITLRGIINCTKNVVLRDHKQPFVQQSDINWT